jgi:hypothetical protein
VTGFLDTVASANFFGARSGWIKTPPQKLDASGAIGHLLPTRSQNGRADVHRDPLLRSIISED